MVILATGGTIAGTAAHASQGVGYMAAQLGVAQLLAAVPDLGDVAGGGLLTEQVAQLDSKDMDVDTWLHLARRCAHWLARDEIGAVVITHGTDTLEETAWFLEQVLPLASHGKPVVLTCAMRPATALLADGPQNLRDAVATAVDAHARGVLVVAAGEVHGARAVRKQHPYRVNAFSSAELGPMGWVEEGYVRWQQLPREADVGPVGHPALEDLPAGDSWPWVEWVSSHAGCDGRAVDALVALGVQGLVVAATGNGTVHHALEAALERALRVGVAVWLSTRCSEGQLVAASARQEGLSRPQTVALPPAKARISLQLELLARRA